MLNKIHLTSSLLPVSIDKDEGQDSPPIITMLQTDVPQPDDAEQQLHPTTDQPHRSN